MTCTFTFNQNQIVSQSVFMHRTVNGTQKATIQLHNKLQNVFIT